MHYPFTAPRVEELELLDSGPGAVSIVLNGYELGGGSIRLHLQPVQQKIFDSLGLSPEESEGKFGLLLKAFSYGNPPHGGALGIDRFLMTLTGTSYTKNGVTGNRREK